MKVKLTRDLMIDGVDHQPDEIVDVDAYRARRIIEKGDGVAQEDFPPPAEGPAEIPPPEPAAPPEPKNKTKSVAEAVSKPEAPKAQKLGADAK